MRSITRRSLLFSSAAAVTAGAQSGGLLIRKALEFNMLPQTAEFVAKGRSVVVLDADPQHSLVAWAARGDGLLAHCTQMVEDGVDTLRPRARKAEKDADIVLIDTPPGMPEVGYQAALAADFLLLPCGPSPLDLLALKEALSSGLKARAERRSKKPRISFVP